MGDKGMDSVVHLGVEELNAWILPGVTDKYHILQVLNINDFTLKLFCIIRLFNIVEITLSK